MQGTLLGPIQAGARHASRRPALRSEGNAWTTDTPCDPPRRWGVARRASNAMCCARRSFGVHRAPERRCRLGECV